MASLLRGLPQFPDDTLEPKIYEALKNIHLALANFAEAIELATGVTEYPSDEWAALGVTGALTIGNATKMYVECTVAIAAGEMINLFDSAGELKARLAKADSITTFAHGYATTSGGVGDIIEMQWMRGVTSLIGSVAVGVPYYLSQTTAGAISNTPSSAVGYMQFIGLGAPGSVLIVDMHTHYVPTA